jgi:hypothetical protein
MIADVYHLTTGLTVAVKEFEFTRWRNPFCSDIAER